MRMWKLTLIFLIRKFKIRLLRVELAFIFLDRYKRVERWVLKIRNNEFNWLI